MRRLVTLDRVPYLTRRHVIAANEFLDAVEEAEEDSRREAEQYGRPQNPGRKRR